MTNDQKHPYGLSMKIAPSQKEIIKNIQEMLQYNSIKDIKMISDCVTCEARFIFKAEEDKNVRGYYETLLEEKTAEIAKLSSTNSKMATQMKNARSDGYTRKDVANLKKANAHLRMQNQTLKGRLDGLPKSVKPDTVRKRMKEFGISHNELIEATGIPQSTWSNALKDPKRNKPTYEKGCRWLGLIK